MFITRLLTFIRGYIRFSISGHNIEKFFNYTIKNHIYIWHTSKIDNQFFTNTSIKNYKKIYKSVRNNNIKLKIQKKYGLPFIVYKYKKRFGILLGILIFFSFLFIMSQFIWYIEVHGAKETDTTQLIKFISSSYIRQGSNRHNINAKNIEKNVLLNFENISWISINIKGSKAEIEIKERIMPPEIIDSGEPCNIVASKSGQIKYLEVYDGQKVVESGDFVKKGQILVSGIIEDKKLNNTLTHSRAKIIATVNEKIKHIEPFIEERYYYNGNSFTNIELEIMNQKIPINFKKNLKHNVEICESTIYPNIFDMLLPIKIHKFKNNEIIKKTIKLSETEAKLKALKNVEQIESNMNNNGVKIISKESETSFSNQDQYFIENDYITEQDIAIQQKIIIE